MVNNFLQYILGTVRFLSDKRVDCQRSSVKWIKFRKAAHGFKMQVSDSSLSHCNIHSAGCNNKIAVYNGALLTYTSISLEGEGNEVVLDGCTGIASIIVRGTGCRVYIGKKTSMEDLYVVCMGQCNSVTIGKDGMIAGKVEIWNTDSHLITDLDGKPLNRSVPVVIGDHVWLGKHTKILKGVTIGDHSVVGMCSIVTRDVPSHAIAAGNPAKTVKEGITWEKGFIEI